MPRKVWRHLAVREAGVPLLALVLAVAIFLLAPPQGKAQEASGGGSGTIPAKLTMHWKETWQDYKTPTDEASGSKSMDFTADMELADKTSRGKLGAIQIGYLAGQLTSSLGSKDVPNKLVSYSGGIHYAHQRIERFNFPPECTDTITEEGSSNLGLGGNTMFMVTIANDALVMLVVSPNFPFPTATKEEISPPAPPEATMAWCGQNKIPTSGQQSLGATYVAGTPGCSGSAMWTGHGWTGTYSCNRTQEGKRGSQSLSFTLEINPEEVEAVIIPPASYDLWIPAAGGDENTAGNSLTVKVELQKKGHPGEKPRRKGQFTFLLQNVSHEPGVCLNWPPPDQVGPNPDFDLKIDQSVNRDLEDVADNGQAANSKDDLQESQVTISSFDWSGWGSLKVTAKLDNGEILTAHLKDNPKAESLKIPMDDNANHIADAWEKTVGLSNSDPKADEDNVPVGDGDKGDGLSTYEEYRGFMVGGKHIRTDPNNKDLFILNPSGLPLGLFAKSGLTLHVVKSNEVQKDPKSTTANPWVINFNSHNKHLVAEHVIFLKAANLPAGVLSTILPVAAKPGPPKNCNLVEIDPNQALAPPVGGQLELQWAVARELAHCTNVPNHGDSDYQVASVQVLSAVGGTENFKLWVPFPGGPWHVAAPKGQESGEQDCIMRSPSADFYEISSGHFQWKSPITGKTVQGESYPPPEPFGTVFCTSNRGTGVNDAKAAPLLDGRKLPKAGDASKGACVNRFCINDTKH